MGLVRFIVALAVASGHASSFFGADIFPKMPGSHAVQIFYIISGFLIALILSGKYADTRQGNWIFYSNRAVKIYVPYLAILAVTTLVWLFIYSVTGNAGPLAVFGSPMSAGAWLYAVTTNIFLIGMEWGSMLIERGSDLSFSAFAIEKPPNAIQYSVIIPAWTLSLELMFYLIAPFILRRHFLVVAALALASYFLRFWAYQHGFRSIATEYRFFPFELSLFLYGALSYRFYVFLKERDMFKPALSLSITLACAFTAIALPKYFRQHQHQMYAVVGILLPALFDFSTRYRWDKWLGDLSYPLYLVHWPICVVVLAALSESGRGSFVASAVVAASIGSAIAINHVLVYPIDVWRQRRAKIASVPDTDKEDRMALA
jgi:peptidoglycan/LPS O-acetylase OafA/YrhL